MKEKMVLIATRIPQHVYDKVRECVPEEFETESAALRKAIKVFFCPKSKQKSTRKVNITASAK